jgi:hypothetical protein
LRNFVYIYICHIMVYCRCEKGQSKCQKTEVSDKHLQGYWVGIYINMVLHALRDILWIRCSQYCYGIWQLEVIIPFSICIFLAIFWTTTKSAYFTCKEGVLHVLKIQRLICKSLIQAIKWGDISQKIYWLPRSENTLMLKLM